MPMLQCAVRDCFSARCALPPSPSTELQPLTTSCSQRLSMLCWQSYWAIGKCVIDAGAHAARDLSCGTCACSMASGRPFEIPRFAESVRLMLAGRCAFAQVNGASCNVANLAAKFPPARLCTATRRTAISHGWPHDMCSHDGTGPNRGPARPYATKRTPRDP